MHAVIFFIVAIIALIAGIIGLINPRLVVRWGDKRNRVMVLKVYYPIFIVALFVFIALIPKPDEPKKGVTKPMPQYFINKQTSTESRVKTQVAMEVIVPDCADRDRLKALMEHLYNDAARSTGYKLRKHPNAVYIRLWRSTDEMGQVMPLARVDKHALNDEPTYIFDDDRLAAFNLPADYLGMTEQQRRALWDGYHAISTKYLALAKKAHPESKNPWEWVDNDKVKSLRAQLLASHHISVDVFDKIFGEGQGKGWPEEVAPQ